MGQLLEILELKKFRTQFFQKFYKLFTYHLFVQVVTRKTTLSSTLTQILIKNFITQSIHPSANLLATQSLIKAL